MTNPKINKKKVIVVMPAYNAEKTIKKTYYDIPAGIADEVVVVDDDSHDKTVEIARNLGLSVYIHKNNLGYGGNQKTCYEKALDKKADIIVMIHPDYQYDATLTGDLVKPVLEDRFDIMLGSRLRNREETLKNGMPVYKYIFNRFLTLMENIVLGLNLSEYHTGFRAFNKKSLSKINFQNFSNDFIFDQQILIDAHLKGFRIGEIFVPCKYTKESSSINFIRSVKYGLEIMINLIWAILKINLYQ